MIGSSALVLLARSQLPSPRHEPFLSPTGVEIAFVLVGLMALAAAVLVVTSANLVHAALWLVVSLGALAGCYLLLTAEFVAWMQVIIYIGAVVVLLLFGLMLTKAPIGRSATLDSGNRPAAALVALAAAGTLVTVVVDAFRTAYIELGGAGAGSTRVVGESLFRFWVLPFELLSVLLLAALVGAIVLSRTDIGSRARAVRTRSQARTDQRARSASPSRGEG